MRKMKKGLLLPVAVLLLAFVVAGAGLQSTAPADSGIEILSFSCLLYTSDAADE